MKSARFALVGLGVLAAQVAWAQAGGGSRRPEAEYEIADEANDAAAKQGDSEKFGLLKPTNDAEAWRFELNDQGDGVMAVIDDAIVFVVTKTTGTNWHVQAYQSGLDLDDGKEYVLKFQMKSPEEMTVQVAGQINEPDWHEIGLHEEIATTKDYKDYEVTFTATSLVKGNNRVGVVLGASRGIVYLKDMSLKAKE